MNSIIPDTGTVNVHDKRITALIISRDAKKVQARIDDLLSLAFKVVVVSNGSIEFNVFSHLDGVKIVPCESRNFSFLRNLGAFYSDTEYILNIDSDEVITDDLKQSLCNPPPIYDAFYSTVVAVFGDKIVNMWHSRSRIKLVKKSSFLFTGRVHEKQWTFGLKVGKLNGDIINFSYADWEEYREKVERYTHVEDRTIGNFIYTSLKTIFLYLFNRGIKDGLFGLKLFFHSILYSISILTDGKRQKNLKIDKDLIERITKYETFFSPILLMLLRKPPHSFLNRRFKGLLIDINEQVLELENHIAKYGLQRFKSG